MISDYELVYYSDSETRVEMLFKNIKISSD